MIPELPSVPPVNTYFWTGHYAENQPPVAERYDWTAGVEDGREAALLDVLVKQFDQWTAMDGDPQRARRVLAYLSTRYG